VFGGADVGVCSGESRRFFFEVLDCFCGLGKHFTGVVNGVFFLDGRLGLECLAWDILDVGVLGALGVEATVLRCVLGAVVRGAGFCVVGRRVFDEFGPRDLCDQLCVAQFASVRVRSEVVGFGLEFCQVYQFF
jgi:hypothetical protein